MRILLYGVGALGSLMTHFLCKAGNDVTIVARSFYAGIITISRFDIMRYLCA